MIMDLAALSETDARLRLGSVVGARVSWVDSAGASAGAVHESFSGGDGCRVRFGIEFEHRDREGLAASGAVAAGFGHDDGYGAHGFQGRRLCEHRIPVPRTRRRRGTNSAGRVRLVAAQPRYVLIVAAADSRLSC